METTVWGTLHGNHCMGTIVCMGNHCMHGEPLYVYRDHCMKTTLTTIRGTLYAELYLPLVRSFWTFWTFLMDEYKISQMGVNETPGHPKCLFCLDIADISAYLHGWRTGKMCRTSLENNYLRLESGLILVEWTGIGETECVKWTRRWINGV